MSLIKRIINGSWIPENQSKSSFSWLLMIAFFGWKYFIVTPSNTEIVLAILSVLLFIALFVATYWVPASVRVAIIFAMFLLGAVWSPVNPGSATFIIFAAAKCTSIEPVKRAYQVLIVLMVLLLLETVMIKLPPDFWVPSFLVSTAMGIAGIMQGALRRSREKLIRSQEEVAHLATIAERERISRDLHDLLGHTLSLITIKAELANKLLQRDQLACQKEINDIETCARNALSEVRAAVSGYRQIGFTHELANAANCLSAAQITLSTQIDHIAMNATTENILTLALRESITNITRHSMATHCDIQLKKMGGLIVLVINDNGTKLNDHTQLTPGNGLIGMRERISHMGGQLQLIVKQGLSLQISLPYSKHNSNAIITNSTTGVIE
jgi:two-component system sensor histidine kinase DesK